VRERIQTIRGVRFNKKIQGNMQRSKRFHYLALPKYEPEKSDLGLLPYFFKIKEKIYEYHKKYRLCPVEIRRMHLSDTHESIYTWTNC
jgi:hypothetical protein